MTIHALLYEYERDSDRYKIAGFFDSISKLRVAANKYGLDFITAEGHSAIPFISFEVDGDYKEDLTIYLYGLYLDDQMTDWWVTSKKEESEAGSYMEFIINKMNEDFDLTA